MKGFKKTIGFISLGCDKNRVDTENMITKFARPEFEIVGDETKANIIIINTCAFIEMARNEAKETILEIQNLKKTGILEKLIVVGCLAMLEKENLIKEFSFVDRVVTPEDYDKIDQIVFELYGQKYSEGKNKLTSRLLTTSSHYAYVKIADGCNNRCAFCKIPFIRGNYKSRLISDIVDEAQKLVDGGVREIILVAQDVTRFGFDTKESLVELLHTLSKIKNLVWIRLLYAYPDFITDELISEIKDNPKVVHYLDLPLQHVSNHMLSNMRRSSRKRDIIELINKLRREIPDIKIRSTFMVGFPNETKRDFKELCSFLKVFKLDNVGFFKFSREEGTEAYNMEYQIDEKTKDKRLEIVEKIQQKVITRKNRKLKNQVFKIIVDGVYEDYFVGRPYFSAPDVDYNIYFKSYSKLNLGSFVDVKITNFKDDYFIGLHEKNSTY